ncbi:MAG: hypothetical protein ACSHXY_09830 [Alphaproteobacteria bacterium]
MTIKFTLPKAGTRYSALWPVTVGVPVDDAKIEEQQLKPRFQLMKESEIVEFFEKALKALGEEIPDSEATLRKFGPLGVIGMHLPTCKGFLDYAIMDIEGLTQETEDGQSEPIEYSQEVLSGILEMSFVRSALMTGFFEFNTGALAKNSKTSSG